MSAQFTRAKPHVVNGFLDVPKELPKGCKPTARPPVARGKLINNIANSSETERENFLIAMTRPLVMYGATLNMLEDRLLAAARHLNVKVTVVRKPGEFSCVLGEYGSLRRKIKIRDSGRRTLRHIGVVEVDSIVFDVTHDNVAMTEAVEILGNMEKRGPLKNPFLHVACASALSALICMHAFQATGREVLYTLLSTFMLCVVQLLCKRAGMLAAAFLENAIVVLVSLFAHDSHVHTNIIIGVLPGYLHLSSLARSTDINGGTTIEGYIRTVFAIIYTFALKSGLPLLLDVVLMAKLVGLVYLCRHVYVKITKPERTTVRVTRRQAPKIMQKAEVTTTVEQ